MPTAQPRRHAGHHQPGRQTASGRTSPRQAPATRTHRTSQAPQTRDQANRTVRHRSSCRWGANGTSRRAARSAICCCRYPGGQLCWVACCARTAVLGGQTAVGHAYGAALDGLICRRPFVGSHREWCPSQPGRAHSSGTGLMVGARPAADVSQGSFPCSGNVRANAGRQGRRAVVAGGQAMTYHEYLSKAVQHDAQQAGERDRLLRGARRARMTRPGRVRTAAPVRRLARLLFRRVPA